MNVCTREPYCVRHHAHTGPCSAAPSAATLDWHATKPMSIEDLQRAHAHAIIEADVQAAVDELTRELNQWAPLATGIKHIQANDRQGLCGAKTAGRPPRPSSQPCAVCLDLATTARNWTR